jgi:hypothetical protein
VGIEGESVSVDCGDIVEFEIGEDETDVTIGVFVGIRVRGRISKMSTTLEYS